MCYGSRHHHRHRDFETVAWRGDRAWGGDLAGGADRGGGADRAGRSDRAARGDRAWGGGWADRGGAPDEEHGDIRASDAERERVVEALRAHAEAGRLTPEELEERVEAALAARTRDDLAALQRDLPGPAPAPVASRPHARDRAGGAHHVGFLPIALLLVAIWALTGAGYFWPVWPLAWFAFAAIMRSSHTRVSGNTRRTW